MNQTPFNNDKYMKLQKEEMYERIKKYGKLYIEVGGKLFDDNHAARVLPGFDPNVKLKNFKLAKDDLEVIFCINARDIIAKKVRSDNNLTYSDEVIRLVYCMRKQGIAVCGVVITFYQENENISAFKNKLKGIGVPVYRSYFIENYPNDIDKILSDEGFGKNDYIETHKKLILVSAPGASSGKFETCLSQLYLDKKRGIDSCYAKYETFPVWNLPINHLANLAYEMATTDICDENLVDPYYQKAYGKVAINYNRDIEAFPILYQMFNKIYGYELYKSPTEMGINNVAFAIEDDNAVQEAAMTEIVRRYHHNNEQFAHGKITKISYNRSCEIYERASKIYETLKANPQ